MFSRCNEPTKLLRNIKGRNAMLLLTSLYLRFIDATKWGIWPNVFVTLRKLLWPTPTKYNVCKDDAILESTHLKMCTKVGSVCLSLAAGSCCEPEGEMPGTHMAAALEGARRKVPRAAGSQENIAQLQNSSTAQERRQLQGPCEHPTPGVCIAICSLLLSASSLDNTDNLVYSGLRSPFRVRCGPISSEGLFLFLLISVVPKQVSPSACWAGSPLLSE